MAQQHPGHAAERHDWHSADYVQQWVSRDDTNRLLVVRSAVDHLPFPRDCAIKALDIGAGYGIFAGELLSAFPQAEVTLQDFSQPMLDHARERLSAHAGRIRFVTADFSKPDWANSLGGPFDAAVSGIAIHHLYNDDFIASVYRGVCGVMAPGGVFLNLDYAEQSGSVEAHLEWLRKAGFSSAQEAWRKGKLSLLEAHR